MTVAAVLAELDRRGVIAYRTGDTIRLRPAAALSPDLLAAVRQHKAELLAALSDTVPHRAEDWLGLKVDSRILGRAVWLVAAEADADTLEADLAAEGEPALVFTVAEVLAVEGMLAGDAQTLARVKRLLPGSRIASVTRHGELPG